MTERREGWVWIFFFQLFRSLIPHFQCYGWRQGSERRECQVPEHTKSDDEDNQDDGLATWGRAEHSPLFRHHAPPQASTPVSDKRQ